MSKISSLILLIVVTMGLANCGGGGGGGDTASPKMTGYVNDGAIRNAKVCLDLDSNGACDANEPSAVSGAGGLYSFTYPASTDISKLHVLAIIDTGATDEDYGRITKPYNMLAPATSPSSVSPLTTLISTDMMVRNVTATDAESKLKREYGITQNVLGLNVANDADLHGMAQVTAISLAETQRVIKSDATAIAAGLSSNDVLKQSVQQVKDNVLKNVVAAGGKVSIDTSSPTSQDAVLVNINAQLPSAIADAVSKNMPAVITSAKVGDGSDVDMAAVFKKGLVLATSAGGGSTSVLAPGSSEPTTITYTTLAAMYYQCDTQTMSASDSCVKSRKLIAGNAWADVVGTPSTNIVFDGVEWKTAPSNEIRKPVIQGNCVSVPITPTKVEGLTYCTVEKNLGGKSIKSVIPLFCKNSNGTGDIAECNPEAVLPTGAKVYDFNVSVSADYYQINYNDNWGGYGSPGTTTVADFLSKAKTNVVMVSGCDLGMLVDNYDDKTGKGQFKFGLKTSASGNGCFNARAEQFTERSDFYVKKVGGKDVVVWGVPNLYKKLNGGTPLYRIFTTYAGAHYSGIFDGEFRPSGQQEAIRFTGQMGYSPQVMNQVAFDALIAQRGKPPFPYPVP